MEEKYRKAMVSNAQLDNEKNNLMYQVDTLKDSLMELEELLSESRREYDEKVKVRRPLLCTDGLSSTSQPSSLCRELQHVELHQSLCRVISPKQVKSRPS